MNAIKYDNIIAYPHKIDGYFATKCGKAISVKKIGGNGKLDFNNPREMGVKYDKDGYKELCLSHVINGKQKRISIKLHQFVWEVFNGNRNLELTIDHIDGDRTNNGIDNLQELTREANTSKARKGKTTWQKGKKHLARNFYDIYIEDSFVGNFDKQECIEKFGLSRYDVDEYQTTTKRKSEMSLRIEKRVEDIERVDSN